MSQIGREPLLKRRGGEEGQEAGGPLWEGNEGQTGTGASSPGASLNKESRAWKETWEDRSAFSALEYIWFPQQAGTTKDE